MMKKMMTMTTKRKALLFLTILVLPILTLSSSIQAGGIEPFFFDLKDTEGNLLPFEIELLPLPTATVVRVRHSGLGVELCSPTSLIVADSDRAFFDCRFDGTVTRVFLERISNGRLVWSATLPGGQTFSGFLCRVLG